VGAVAWPRAKSWMGFVATATPTRPAFRGCPTARARGYSAI